MNDVTGRPETELTFEEAMAELEAVVGQLERGDVPLEQSIALYERGARLKARCAEKLAEAEERVELIRVAEGKATGATPLGAGAAAGQDAPEPRAAHKPRDPEGRSTAATDPDDDIPF